MPKAAGEEARRGLERTLFRNRGDGPIPRSMGLVFEYIRNARGMSAREMDVHFRSKEMQDLSGFKELRIGAGTKKKYGGRIGDYEGSKTDPSFGTQHRYGVVSGTRTGVIHIVSLFYAHLRCAANARDALGREAELKAAEATAQKFMALAVASEAMVKECRERGVLTELRDKPTTRERRMAHARKVIGPLLKAYRDG